MATVAVTAAGLTLIISVTSGERAQVTFSTLGSTHTYSMRHRWVSRMCAQVLLPHVLNVVLS